MIDSLVEGLERLTVRLHVELESLADNRDQARRLQYLALEAEDVLEKAKTMLPEQGSEN